MYYTHAGAQSVVNNNMTFYIIYIDYILMMYCIYIYVMMFSLLLLPSNGPFILSTTCCGLFINIPVRYYS